MTISVLFGSRKAGKIGELQLDAAIREIHSYRNDVSRFPVEEGSDITDNIRIEPDEISIVGFVTNSPIDVLQANNAEVIEKVDGEVEVKNLKRTEVINKVELAQDILLRISGRKIEGENQDPQLVDIVTGLRVYRQMAMQTLRIPRDISVGQAMRFEATFIGVQKVTSESVVIPNPTPLVSDLAQSTNKKGKRTPSTSKTSILRKAVDAVVDFGSAKRF